MRHLMKRARLAALLAVGALAFTATGCGDDPENSTPPPGSGGPKVPDVKAYDPARCPPFEDTYGWHIEEDITIDGCYYAEDGIESEHHVTVLPGSSIYFGTYTGMNISGNLTAIGTKEKPILFAGAESTPGFWPGVIIASTNENLNALHHVTIDGGGRDNHPTLMWGKVSPANLMLSKIAGEDARARVSLENVTLSNSGADGLWATNTTIIESFKNNIMTKSAGSAARVSLQVAHHFGTDSSFTGNADNQILIDATEIIDAVRLPLLPHTYRVVGQEIRFRTPEAQLAVAPGVVMEFPKNSGLYLLEGASLIAEGTPQAPITFKGVEDTAGFWTGVFFRYDKGFMTDYDENTVTTDNSLAYVNIENAGHESHNSATLTLSAHNWVKPLTISLNNVRLSGSSTEYLLKASNVILSHCENLFITSTDIGGDTDGQFRDMCGL